MPKFGRKLAKVILGDDFGDVFYGWVKDWHVDTAFTQAVEKSDRMSFIKQRLKATGKNGFLLECKIYTRMADDLVIGDDFCTIHGEGDNPDDALLQSLRAPSIGPQPPSLQMSEERTFFAWLSGPPDALKTERIEFPFTRAMWAKARAAREEDAKRAAQPPPPSPSPPERKEIGDPARSDQARERMGRQGGDSPAERPKPPEKEPPPPKEPPPERNPPGGDGDGSPIKLG